MTSKLFVLLLLSLTIAACDPGPTETNSNANNAPKANTNVSVAPSPAPSPSAEASPSIKAPVKAGDKVRVAVNGSFSDATVVSVDEKSGKVTVKLSGQGGEKTVSVDEIVREQ